MNYGVGDTLPSLQLADSRELVGIMSRSHEF